MTRLVRADRDVVAAAAAGSVPPEFAAAGLAWVLTSAITPTNEMRAQCEPNPTITSISRSPGYFQFCFGLLR